MENYAIVDLTSSERFDYQVEPGADYMEEMCDKMYIHREMHPATHFWKSKLLQGETVLWTYHNLEFMGMTYDPATKVFTIKDMTALPKRRK